MTSFLKLIRICEFCSNEFESKTTVTRFCSKLCNRKSNKMRVRNLKINASNEETFKKKFTDLEELKKRDFLSVNDVALILNCSKKTVYFYIENGTIESVNLGKRMTRIKRESLDKLILKPEIVSLERNEPIKQVSYDLSDCISTFEVREKYQISESALRNIIIKNKIPKMRDGSYAFVPKVIIENILGL